MAGWLPLARGSTVDDIAVEGGQNLRDQKRDWEALQHFRDKSLAAQGRTMGEVGSSIANDRASVEGVLGGDYRNAMDLAQQAALGQGTSAAMQQQLQGQQAARNAQLAMANSAGGSRYAQAAAMQNATGNAGLMAQQAVNQNEALRAQEMAAGRQQYAQLSDAYQSQLRGLRGSEIGMQQGNQALNDKAALGWEAMRNEQDINSADWRMKYAQQAYAKGLAQRQQEDANGAMMEGILGGTAQGIFKMASDARIKDNVELSDKHSRHLLAQWRRR